MSADLNTAAETAACKEAFGAAWGKRSPADRAMLLAGWFAARRAPLPAEQPSNPVPVTDDAALLDWLQAQMVDTIYFDAGGIIDVQSGDLRKAIRARIVGQQTKGGGNG